MRFISSLIMTCLVFIAVSVVYAGQRDLLNGAGGFEKSGEVTSTRLPSGWETISANSSNQQLSIGKGNRSKSSLVFTKSGNEHALFHRIGYRLNNIRIPAGTKLTLMFDYHYKDASAALVSTFTVGLSETGGSSSAYDGSDGFVEGSSHILTKDNITAGKWITVTKVFTTAKDIKNPYILISENYWETSPYEIAIDNIRLMVDGGMDMRIATKMNIRISDGKSVASSKWQRGEDHGAKLDMQLTEPADGVEVAYDKETGGGYCTIEKSFEQAFDLSQYKTVVIDADFSANQEHQLRNINNEGHSGIAFWIQDEKGKKAYYDVYSVVPMQNGRYKYYYLLESPLGPFNGKPERSEIKKYGLQVSKTERPGKGGFKINSISLLMKAELGDAEIAKKYRLDIANFSADNKPNLGKYFVASSSANVKYRNTYVPKPGLKNPVITLASARSATAHAQLVFLPSVEARSLRVTVKPDKLKGVKSAVTIPASSIRAFAVGHVGLKPNTVQTKYAGWHPDMVLNTNKLSLSRDKTDTAWIQINVPANVPADTYTGNIEISTADRNKLSVPVTLKVYDIDLPVENKIRTSFWAFRGMVAKYLGKPDITVEEMYPYYKLSLEHRLSPIDQNDGIKPLYTIYREKDNTITVDADEFEKYLVFCKENSNGAFNAFNIAEHAWYGINLQNGFKVIDRETGQPWKYDNSPFSADNLRICKASIDAPSDIAQKHGVLQYAYLQPFDEPSPNEPLFPKIIAALKAMELRVPIEVVFAVNESIDYYPEMTKDIDIWTPSLYTLRDSDIQYQQGRGKEIWSYVCTGGNPLVPNKPNHDRWFFLQNFKKGSTGFLNWGLNYWGNISSDLWAKGIYDGYGNYDNSAIGQGDGVLMYPDATASIRLKGLLRGVEDYQYAWMLRDLYIKAGNNISGSLASEIEELLSVNSLMGQISAGDTDCIDRWRDEVCEAILQLQKK